MKRIIYRFSFVVLYCLLIFFPVRLACSWWPVFMPGNLAWDASDIVIVAVGDNHDGLVSVKEIWKGGLSVGEQLSIPGLPYLTSESDRKAFVDISDWMKDSPAAHLNGEEMILFIKKKSDNQTGSTTIVAGKSVVWQAADRYGSFNASVAWIEAGEVYAYRQMSNPGYPIMMHITNINQIKEIVNDQLSLQQKFTYAISILAPDRRVLALSDLANGNLGRTQEEAIKALGESGAEAAPALLQMFLNQNLNGRFEAPTRSIREALVKTGGNDIGPKLKWFILNEVIYWRSEAPGLTVGWWNNSGLRNFGELRRRYGVLFESLIALKQIHYSKARKEISELMIFWRSLPQLEDTSGLNQISQECDKYLKSLSAEMNQEEIGSMPPPE